jgi:hypothetical protein
LHFTHAVLHQLAFVDREDGATLMVAKRIIDLATLGERDPERLMAATMGTSRIPIVGFWSSLV